MSRQWDRTFGRDSQVQSRLLQEGMALFMVCMAITPDIDLQMTCHHPRKWSVNCKLYYAWQTKWLNFLHGVWEYFHFILNLRHFLCRNLILKGPGALPGMVVLQRGLSCRAAGQAPLASLVRTGQAGWSQVVVACQQPKEFNLGSSPKQRLSPALLQPLEAVATTHLEALNSSQSVRERGNKMVRPSWKQVITGCAKFSKFYYVAIKKMSKQGSTPI